MGSVHIFLVVFLLHKLDAVPPPADESGDGLGSLLPVLPPSVLPDLPSPPVKLTDDVVPVALASPPHSQTGSEGVPLKEFLPFGKDKGDTVMAKKDDAFDEVPLDGEPFTFFETEYKKLFINTNGGISFREGITKFTPECTTLNQPMIVPFWADIDNTYGGDIYYRQTSKPQALQRVEALLRTAFPSTSTYLLKATWAFIATWDNVPFFGAERETSSSCPGINLRNTFQAILVRGEVQSYVIFLYNKIQWTTGRASGGNTCTGLGGTPAKAGFDYGDRAKLFSLPDSCTPGVLKVKSISNVNANGRWVFKVAHDVEERNCEVECADEDTGEEYLADPYDCHRYYQCANGVPHHLPCGKTVEGNLVFNPSNNNCDWPKDYKCRPSCFKENRKSGDDSEL